MNELELKYGCNPTRTPARAFMRGGGTLPLSLLNGMPSFMDLLDALTGWQLAQELKETLQKPAAAVCKQATPTAAAIGLPLGETLKKACFLENAPDLEESPLACAYARARGADRVRAFGGWTALSDVCDEAAARLIQWEVSSGIIAPGYTKKALEILRTKRKGTYCILQIAPGYVPPEEECIEIFGITMTRPRNHTKIEAELLENIVTANRDLPDTVRRDLMVALVTLKYTPSSAVCYAAEGQTIGIGSGQSSHIYCTRQAGDRADAWHLRRHPRALCLPLLPSLSRFERDNVIDNYLCVNEEDVCEEGNWQKYFIWRPDPLTVGERRTWLDNIKGVSMASDGLFPSANNVERARRSGVRYIAEPGGSPQDEQIIAKCDGYDMVLAFTNTKP